MSTNGSELAQTMGNAKRSPEMGMGAFQQYQDAAYQQAQRNIAPQQQMQQKKFDQQMVNKGLTPGSNAYNLAQAQMQRGQNDQNQAANFGAMQFGQAAQEQAFGQDFKNRSLSQNESQFGRSLGEQGRQFDTGMSQRESEFGRNFGLQEGQANFSNLMGMGDMALKFGNFANQGIMSDANLAQGQLGSAPNSGVFGIDTQGAYNSGMQGANNVAGQNSANYGAFMGAAGNALGAMSMPSALEFKIMDGVTDQHKRDHIASTILSIPIYDWDYKPQYREKGDRKRFGCLADDFNAKIINDGGEQTIDVQRYLSALHITLQELFHENKRLENLLWHVAESQGIPLDGKPYVGKKGMGVVFDMAEKLEAPRHWKDVPAETA